MAAKRPTSFFVDAAGLRLARLAVLLGGAALLWGGMLSGMTDAVAGDAADVVVPDVELFVPTDGSRVEASTAS